MSDDQNTSEPFDFDYDMFNAEVPQANAEEKPFDGENFFGDELAPLSNDSESSVEDPVFNDSFVSTDSASASGDDSSVEGSMAESADSEEPSSAVLEVGEKAGTKKKGFGGWFAKGKEKPGKAKKEKPKREAKPKKEKPVKAKKPVGERVPHDLETILCIVFSVFLLASLLLFDILFFFVDSGKVLEKLLFIGAFNIVGAAAASVPILFYRFPKERTLPNVMLGSAAVALFCAVQFAVYEFYTFSFMLRP